jgi:hypothetical protein
LDRTAYLIRTQLEVVSLIGDQVTKFHRKHASLVSNNQREVPMLKINVISTLEVVVNSDLLLSISLAVSELEDSVLGMSPVISILRATVPSKLLDGVSLHLCRNC